MKTTPETYCEKTFAKVVNANLELQKNYNELQNLYGNLQKGNEQMINFICSDEVRTEKFAEFVKENYL